MTTPPWKIVTTEQLKEGYYVLIGCIAHRREYQMIAKNEDGTYTVRNPELATLEEKARLKKAGIIP